MTIRPAAVTDLPAVIRLVTRAYEMYVARIGQPPGPMQDDYAARIRRHEAWVAEEDGSVTGLLVLVAEDGHLLLDNVAVDPGRQGRGLGRALLDFADHEARRRGYTELRLYTNEAMTENLVLYPRLGWQEIGRGVQHGFRRVFFRKPLA